MAKKLKQKSSAKKGSSSETTPEQNFAKAYYQEDINTQQMNKIMSGETNRITGKSDTNYVQTPGRGNSNPYSSLQNRGLISPLREDGEPEAKDSAPVEDVSTTEISGKKLSVDAPTSTESDLVAVRKAGRVVGYMRGSNKSTFKPN
jgi:hypothetical protein